MPQGAWQVAAVSTMSVLWTHRCLSVTGDLLHYFVFCGWCQLFYWASGRKATLAIFQSSKSFACACLRIFLGELGQMLIYFVLSS